MKLINDIFNTFEALQNVLNKIKDFSKIDISDISVDFDLQDTDQENARFLVFLNQSYQMNPFIFALLPANMQTLLYDLHQQSKVYMDIIPKIANGEVTESQIEDYLLKKAFHYRKKKENQWLAKRLQADEI